MISQSDKFLINRLIQIKEKGYYASGKEVTDVYNRVFGAHLAPTSCGSCIRTRINLLEKELSRQEELEAKELEEQMKEAQVADNKEEKENGKEETENGKVRQSIQRKKSSGKTAVD